MLVIGIDPGASGGIAVLDTSWEPMSGEPSLTVHKMPATEHDAACLLRDIGRPRFAFIEAVHSMPRQGVASSFKFGRSYGFLRGVLSGVGIPFEDVTPQAWQKALRCLSKGDKNVTKAAAGRLWPDMRWTHATADAALIAEYGRQTLIRTGRA